MGNADGCHAALHANCEVQEGSGGLRLRQPCPALGISDAVRGNVLHMCLRIKQPHRERDVTYCLIAITAILKCSNMLRPRP